VTPRFRADSLRAAGSCNAPACPHFLTVDWRAANGGLASPVLASTNPGDHHEPRNSSDDLHSVPRADLSERARAVSRCRHHTPGDDWAPRIRAESRSRQTPPVSRATRPAITVLIRKQFRSRCRRAIPQSADTAPVLLESLPNPATPSARF